MRNIWFFGFLGFLSLITLKYLKTHDPLDFLWVLWIFWFLYFLPKKIIIEKIIKPTGETDLERTERRRGEGIVS